MPSAISPQPLAFYKLDWDLADTPKKRVAGLAVFYCGCNQSKSLHICGCKDTTKN